jgi:hypothetical protein
VHLTRLGQPLGERLPQTSRTLHAQAQKPQRVFRPQRVLRPQRVFSRLDVAVLDVAVLDMTPPQAWSTAERAAAARAGAERRPATDRNEDSAGCHPYGASIDTMA